MNTTSITTGDSINHNQDDIIACQECLVQWYSLWTQWIRGLTERSVVMEGWKKILLVDGNNNNNNNNSSMDRPPFVWIDDFGITRTITNSNCLDALIHSPTTSIKDETLTTATTTTMTTDEDEDDESMILSSLSSLRHYGCGVTWNEIETTIDEWQIHPIIDNNNDVNSDDSNNTKKHVRSYRVTCRVRQQIDRRHHDSSKTIVISRQVSAMIQCCSKDYNNESTVAARLIHLQETRILQDPKKPPADSTFSRHKMTTKTANNIPSRHRYIAAPDILKQYGAKPMLVESSSLKATSNTSKATAATTNHSELVGISIQGWNIATSQGYIGDQTWFEQATANLEPLARYRGTTTTNTTTTTTTTSATARKLVLPEMVFPLAHVVLEYNTNSDEIIDENEIYGHFPQQQDPQTNKDQEDVFLVWDAMDALQEWSHAHGGIPMPQQDNNNTSKFTASTTNNGSSLPVVDNQTSSSISYRGVNVLESSDASLWKEKAKDIQDQQRNNPTSTTTTKTTTTTTHIGSTEFHFDWTYSTPFAGNIFVSGHHIQGSKNNNASPISWKPLPQSGMPMYLLTDTSAPILYYDHIILYEDDLHDNGGVEYSVKVRVMPHVAYVLARLFVRVDHVLVRVREARWLILFPSSQEQTAKHNIDTNQDDAVMGTKIYRDVTWREALWKDLGPKYQLPSQVQAWTTDSSTRETQTFQTILSKLPLVDTPSDIHPHAELSYSNNTKRGKTRKKRAPVGVTGSLLGTLGYIMIVLAVLHLDFVKIGGIAVAASTSSSDSSSYVSVRALDKFGNAKQVSHALEAAKRQGRPVIVAVVKCNGADDATALTGPRSSTSETNEPQSFLVAVSLGTAPILHSLQITAPGDTVSTCLAMCCTGIKGDANWLVQQIQTFSASVWERYNIPSDQISTATIAHVVARLMIRFACYAEDREWNSNVGLPGVKSSNSKDEDGQDNGASSKWSRPLGLQSMILSTASSATPGLLQIDPSGRILTAFAQSSSGRVLTAAMGRDSDKVQSRLLKLFENDGKVVEQSWESTVPSLEQCQEMLVKILLEETSVKVANVDPIHVESFSSLTGRLERKTVFISEIL
ncbi:TIP41-like family protein [Nitzschia inconspicua]|uniref:TIP41-like family protein n=1 Tax=Nitzschia inconspicua TaxID=303405 RepID=A0A9K3L8N4_9STRA|nr:TIP41-like family protein [Nitzschia inconspicua]